MIARDYIRYRYIRHIDVVQVKYLHHTVYSISSLLGHLPYTLRRFITKAMSKSPRLGWPLADLRLLIYRHLFNSYCQSCVTVE